MDFFDKLGQKASEAYKVTADKTGKLAKEAKLRMKISDLKSQISNIYEEIGKKVYENHIREEKNNIEKEIEEECTKIDVLSAEIESNLKQCLELKDKKQCQECYKEIEKDVKFCPNCGAKQEENNEKETKEVEVLEKNDDNSGTDYSQKDESNNKNNENKEDCSSLKKTVEIESDVNLEEDKTIQEVKYEEE